MFDSFFSRIDVWSILAAVILLAGCDDQDDQREFEQEAMSEPEGYTETDINGDKVDGGREDPDDWRIAPMYGTTIGVEHPAYPNPTSGDGITITLRVSGIDAVNGLDVRVWYEQREFRQIYYDNNPLQPGLKDVIFDPRDVTPTGNLDHARGLHRIFIFDLNENLITYGDLKIE